MQRHTAHSTTATLAWILTRPPLGRALETIFQFPRTLIVVVAVIGISLIVRDLHRLAYAGSEQAQAPEPVVYAASVPEAGMEAPTALFEVIAAYNEASIAAGLLGQSHLLAPYLTADGEAWAQVQAAFAQREQRGETSDSSLVRWGVLSSSIGSDTALVETQEQWDVITSVGPIVMSSRRGVLVRNHYQLRRTASGMWQIAAIETTPLIR